MTYNVFGGTLNSTLLLLLLLLRLASMYCRSLTGKISRSRSPHFLLATTRSTHSRFCFGVYSTLMLEACLCLLMSHCLSLFYLIKYRYINKQSFGHILEAKKLFN